MADFTREDENRMVERGTLALSLRMNLGCAYYTHFTSSRPSPSPGQGTHLPAHRMLRRKLSRKSALSKIVAVCCPSLTQPTGLASEWEGYCREIRLPVRSSRQLHPTTTPRQGVPASL